MKLSSQAYEDMMPREDNWSNNHLSYEYDYEDIAGLREHKVGLPKTRKMVKYTIYVYVILDNTEFTDWNNEPVEEFMAETSKSVFRGKRGLMLPKFTENGEVKCLEVEFDAEEYSEKEFENFVKKSGIPYIKR